ncbi:MAG: hypothetical protein QJQ54_00590 [Mollicutes bacterium]|nr:MAG: hypothetical protein QJQ54_00590 [Mollicutes bacterium]
MSKINNLEDFKKGAEKVCTNFAHKAARYDFNHINLQLLELIKIDYFGQKSAIAYAVKAQTNPDSSVLLTPHVPTTLGAIYQAILNYKTN